MKNYHLDTTFTLDIKESNSDMTIYAEKRKKSSRTSFLSWFRARKKSFLAISILSATLLGTVAIAAPFGGFYPHLTPTGKNLMDASEYWSREQIKHPQFPQPAMCANNVSVVFKLTGLDHYRSSLVPNMVTYVRNHGGIIIPLPKQPQALSKTLDVIFHGKIPTGSLISGCLRRDCSGEKGDGHVAIVGFTDSEKRIHLYHNNWYRPDNFNPPQRKPWMVSEFFYNKGFIRQWMSTPWIRLETDSDESVKSQTIILPDIDDLDPTNYFVTLSIPREIIEEADVAKEVASDSSEISLERPDYEKICRHVRIIAPSGANLRSTPGGNIEGLAPQHELYEVTASAQNGYLPISVGERNLWIHQSTTERLCQ